MDLHQLQLTYQMENDRLLLRVSFKEEDGHLQEIRAWLTRRLTRNLWVGILHALEMQVTLNQPLAAHASAEIVNMQHHASLLAIQENGGLGAPFETNAESYPIGETPILLVAADFIMNVDQPVRINFISLGGGIFEIAFAPTVLHGFCKLMQEAVQLADWDIELRLPETTESPAPSGLLN